MQVVLIVSLALASLFAILGKCWFLAPTRWGWFMMLVNVFYETGCRGWRKRWHANLLFFLGLGVGWYLVVGPWAGALWLTLFGLLWVHTLLTDMRWRNGLLTVMDARYAGQIPLPLPKLILRLHGPVLRRGPTHDLGDWPVGRVEAYEFVVLNPADRVHCQFPFHVELRAASDAVTIEGNPSGDHEGLDSGEMARLPFRLKAESPSGPVTLTYRLTLGSYEQSGTMQIASIFDPAGASVRDARIDRWKGGARGAWVWRGDTDLYDPATWQSVEGLRPCFALARRFQMPHTMRLSAGLTLDQETSEKHSRAMGLDRRNHEIPGFAQWLREQVHLQTEMDWPVATEKPYACELGNHYWLHYGTHASADEANQWQTWIGPGLAGYAWTDAEPGDSLKEQTDNSLKCVETFQRVLDYTPTAWGIPGRANDRYTPQAIEASGMAVASDSNCQAFVNVFCQPPPHHPEGTEHLVELSKKYPGDPLFGNQLATLKYWTAHAHRHGRVMVFMAHHHLRGWEAASCFRLTEEMLRHVLADYHGDLYVATMTAVGLYWERVLCPKHRCVSVTPGPGLAVTVQNNGDVDLEALPVTVTFAGGRRTMTLVDVPAGGSVTVDWVTAGT